MNGHLRQLQLDGQGTAAPARRRWTSCDLLRTDQAGLFADGEHVELIGGEIIKMSPKGNRHEVVRSELSMFWGDRRGARYKMAYEPALHLGPNDEPEPDIVIHSPSERVYEVTGASALLVAEISELSLSYDLTVKAALYAAYGVRDYWVIDVQAMRLTVHRNPGAEGYADISVHEASESLMQILARELAVRLAELDVGGVEEDATG